MHDASEKNSF